MGKKIPDVIAECGKTLINLALKIHGSPELGFEEYKACLWQTRLLKKWGFEVISPFSGLETAYFAKKGKGKPVFCFLAEYDALPEIGHACGHNLICSAALGAGKALSAVLDSEKRTGTVVIIGTPGEEGEGSKVKLVRENAFKDIDAVIMAHPASRTAIWNGCLAVKRYDISFHGKSSHASESPEKGKNALDAVMLMFQGVNAWRQHLPETCRIHGIVTNGGRAPNIIPEYASCNFYLRADDDSVLEEMQKRFFDIVRGASLMTGTKAEIKLSKEAYKAGRPNTPLNMEFFEAAKKLGMNPVIPSKSGRASTDFGDVSRVVPGTHVYFGISREKIPLHSAKFAKAAAGKYALAQMLKAAEAMARVGYRFFTDKKFRREVKN